MTHGKKILGKWRQFSYLVGFLVAEYDSQYAGTTVWRMAAILETIIKLKGGLVTHYFEAFHEYFVTLNYKVNTFTFTYYKMVV